MEGDNADIIYLDFSKAFDTVSHYHLQMKMKNLNISKKKKKDTIFIQIISSISNNSVSYEYRV